MKTTKIIFGSSLFLALSLVAFSSFAKVNAIKPSIVEKSLEKKDAIEETQIQPFDFDKLFVEAEVYFKAAKSWEKLKCQPKTGFLCTKKECIKRDSTTFLILDKKKELITRCEGENCETFAGKFKQTGVFFNIQSEGPIGTLIRILGDSRYKEITTVGLDAYIANGNCEVIVE